jgi:cytochrome P450
MLEPIIRIPAATIPYHYKSPLGPHGHSLPGGAQRDPLRFALAMTQQYGDIARVRFLSWPGYLVNHPHGVKHVLEENQRNYTKDVYTLKFFRPFLGNGLLTNDGESWLHQRRLVQPALHRQHMAALGTLVTGATDAMLEHWRGFAGSAEPLDISTEMMRLALRITGLALFNIDLSNEVDAVGQAFATVRALLSDYLYVPFTSLNRRVQTTVRKLDTLIYGIIDKHRRQGTDAGDLLSLLLSARDQETGLGMDDRQVRDEVVTLLLAGHETTATMLAWTWYLLSQHPEVEHHLHIELDEVLGGQLPTVERLVDLPYTQMVIKEALRLYPPVFYLGRKARSDDEISGHAIPAGSMILLCPYTTHRHPDFWEQPEVFDPQRFTPERSAGRPHYAYFPFGGGPRLCIGQHLAMMEAQLILATIAQRYRLQLVPGHPVEPELSLTLRPRHGLPMTISRLSI